MGLLRAVKPKNQLAKRVLARRAPKLVENPKNALLLKGIRTNNVISDVLLELHLLKKPHSIKFQRRNNILPFEDATSLEFLTERNDCSLFAIGAHSKKRPNNLTIGRTFDGHILDIIELGVDRFSPVSSFKTSKPVMGSKPCFLFNGDEFENNAQLAKLKNLILDFFRGMQVSLVNLAGLDHIIVCTAVDGKVHFRHYAIRLKKSGGKLPRVELEEVGPLFDFSIRRCKFASDDLYKASTRVPKALKPQKIKNITRSEMDGKIGRVHMNRQDYSKLQTRKMKGLKKRAGGGDDAEVETKRSRVE
mmetsp:Transcript_6765/g.10553  ORF Transcript_6765/g.10553 Transcript_6765/m.10553 type:complete len:304 (+) Transcript_6765:29-940(+)